MSIKAEGKRVGSAIVDGRSCDIHDLYGRLWIVDPEKKRTINRKVYRSLEDVKKDYKVRK